MRELCALPLGVRSSRVSYVARRAGGVYGAFTAPRVPSPWHQAAARASAGRGRDSQLWEQIRVHGLPWAAPPAFSSGFSLSLTFLCQQPGFCAEACEQVPGTQQALLWRVPAAPGVAGAPKSLTDPAPQRGWHWEASHPKAHHRSWAAVCRKRGYWPRRWLYYTLTHQDSQVLKVILPKELYGLFV